MAAPNLVDLAAAIADGRPVDWNALVSSTNDHRDRACLDRLRIIEQIADAHASPVTLSSSLGPPAPDSDEPPATWGSLVLVEKIDGGTYGDVYRAVDPRLDRAVALKLLRRRAANATATIESAVVEEGRLMARVHHPHVVTIYGAERIAGRVGLWMELVEGPTLEAELREKGPFPPHAIVKAGRDLAGALDAIHRARLLHRDLKAQNVLRDDGGRVRVTDFGTSRELFEPGPAPGSVELAGTPLYLAPEVIAGRPASPASDVYSLGVLLYHLATGSFPIRGRSLRELRDAHARGVRASVRETRVDLPRRLAAIIERACHPDLRARFQTAADLEAALQSRSSRWPIAMAGAAVLAVTVAGATATRVVRPILPSEAVSDAPSQPVALITGVDNQTGDSAFDAVAGELAAALSRAGMLASPSTAIMSDLRRSSGLPPGAPLPGSLGLEAAARHGGVTFVIQSEIRTNDRGGVELRSSLLNSRNGRLARLLDEATARDDRATVIARHAHNLVHLIQDDTTLNRSAGVSVELATTQSLIAFQRYSESYRLGRLGNWQAALAPARQAVVEDPAFASGWIWLAWAVRNAAGPTPGTPYPVPEAEQESLAHAERAVSLVGSVPPWERHWILGSAATIRRDDAAALPHYQALLEARPEHYWGANNLVAALSRLIPEMTDPEVAESTLGKARRVIAAERWQQQCQCTSFLDWVPAYLAWRAGAIDILNARVDDALARLRAGTREPLSPAGHFAMALGRLRDAAVLEQARPSAEEMRRQSLLWLADIRGDEPEVRRLVNGLPRRGAAVRPSLFVRAGLLDDARDILTTAPPVYWGQARFDLARGQLLSLENRLDEATPLLESGMRGLLGSGYREQYDACAALAATFTKLGEMGRVVQTLEECTVEPPPYSRVTGPTFTGATAWMSLKLDLADEYRLLNRISGAQAIENDILRRLRYADADHPLVLRLGRRGR